MFFVFISSKIKKVFSTMFIVGIVMIIALILNVDVFNLIDLDCSDYAAEDVYMGGRNLGGLSREEISDILRGRLVEWQVSPVDALYNSEDNTIVPELWGYKIDIDATVDKIMNAEAQNQVKPVFMPLYPLVTMEDYPSAVITQGNTHKQKVSFMINVAWGEEHIPEMLELFSSFDVQANFFVVGTWAQKNRRFLKQIHKKGHIIGNHGHTDEVVYTELLETEIREGLKEVNSMVEGITNEKVEYFTPHKGEYNELVLEVVSREDMKTILWSLDTVDWMEPGEEEMKSRVLENLHNGAIILMHPTSHTVEFLREAIPYIIAQDLKIVTLEELLHPEYYPYYPSLL